MYNAKMLRNSVSAYVHVVISEPSITLLRIESTVGLQLTLLHMSDLHSYHSYLV